MTLILSIVSFSLSISRIHHFSHFVLHVLFSGLSFCRHDMCCASSIATQNGRQLRREKQVSIWKLKNFGFYQTQDSKIEPTRSNSFSKLNNVLHVEIRHLISHPRQSIPIVVGHIKSYSLLSPRSCHYLYVLKVSQPTVEEVEYGGFVTSIDDLQRSRGTLALAPAAPQPGWGMHRRCRCPYYLAIHWV